jgi:chromosome segregation ATPase
MKYQEKLNELGMTEQDLSASILKSIANLNEIISTYNDAQESLEEISDEEDLQNAQEDIEQIKGDIEELDERILEKIEDYNKNKEMYAERGRKMQEGRKAKVSGNVASQPQPQYQPQPNVEVLEAPKKKSNWALWLVAGIVALVTVNQVLIKVDD